MKPDKTSVYDLFDRQRRYEVPLYQRQYVWTKDNQWAPLWDDIADKAHFVQTREVKSPHFLGAIVTSQRQVFGPELNSWEIIDGQQRLTTLQVVLMAFADVLRGRGETRYERDMQRITRNEGVMRDPAERYKVWPTNSDRDAFKTVMEAGSLQALLPVYPGLRGRQKRQVPRLAEAYAFFFHQIEQFIAGTSDAATGDSSGRAEALFETFKRYLQIVNIELEADDDPQVIFESLNGRGVPLLPSDLVRNFVFMRAGRAGANLDSLYGERWKSYDEWRRPGDEGPEPWWKREERQGRNRRSRIDLFLHQSREGRDHRQAVDRAHFAAGMAERLAVGGGYGREPRTTRALAAHVWQSHTGHSSVQYQAQQQGVSSKTEGVSENRAFIDQQRTGDCASMERGGDRNARQSAVRGCKKAMASPAGAQEPRGRIAGLYR